VTASLVLGHNISSLKRNKKKKINYFFSITPQAIRAPLLPAGSVIRSSGPA
jgi:hypothetical protein